MKLLICLFILLSLATAAAQSTNKSEPAEKKSPSQSDAAAPPQLKDEDPDMEISENAPCMTIRAFVFRMTEDQRLQHVGTITCVPSNVGRLKKIDLEQPPPSPAVHAY